MSGTTDGRRLYDWWARHPRLYDGFTRLAFFGRREQLRSQSIDALGLDPGDRVLDLACGAGANFRPLAAGVGPSGSVVAVDYAAGMTEAARGRAGGFVTPVEVVRGDAAALPLSDGSVDAAYSSLSVSAMPDHGAALREVRRVLRPGGRLAVFDAQPFQSLPWSLLNPVLEPFFAATTDWRPDHDVPAALRTVFPSVEVETFSGGSAFVALAERAP